MTNIKIYGQHTSLNEYVKMMIKRNSHQAGISLSIQEIDNWEEIVHEKVLSLPTIKINGQYNISLDKGQDVHEFIDAVTLKILKEESTKSMKRILVPTDFSAAATNALVYAKEMNSQLQGRIQLIHVHKPEAVYIEGSPIIDENIEHIRRKELEDFVLTVNQSWTPKSDHPMPIDAIFKVGFVANELDELCSHNDEKCFIVAGSIGASGRMKKIFGSVSTQIAKTCKSPVLIVPFHSSYQSIKNIAFALDDLETDVKALPKLLDFATTFGADVHLVHVKRKEPYQGDTLEKLAKSSHPQVKVKYHLIEGDDVVEMINNYATKNTADIIAMTRHNRGFFADLFHKSVTKKMAINTSIPLLLMHVNI